jgi:hypothetical protein
VSTEQKCNKLMRNFLKRIPYFTHAVNLIIRNKTSKARMKQKARQRLTYYLEQKSSNQLPLEDEPLDQPTHNTKKNRTPLVIDVAFHYSSTHLCYQGLSQLFSAIHLIVFLYNYLEHALHYLIPSTPIMSSCNGSIEENGRSRIGTYILNDIVTCKCERHPNSKEHHKVN